MELQIRRHLSVESAQKINIGFKTKLTESILSNEDVQFHWTVVGAAWEEEESAALLELVVDLFVTIKLGALHLSVHGWSGVSKRQRKVPKSLKAYANIYLPQQTVSDNIHACIFLLLMSM